jgi:acetyl esterase/lipase
MRFPVESNSRVARVLAAVVSLCFAPALLAADGEKKKPIAPRTLDTARVRVIEDVAYRDLYPNEEAAKKKNRLDLYLPKDTKDYPVILFVHGGAWVHGDKDYFGLYSNFAMYWAKHGIGTVVTNYRLSPGVRHPEHVKDVARAFAWTVKNISAYGGAAGKIFLCGHSAGGHLVSLLATDDSYLKAEGLGLANIKGVVSISGVYRLDGIKIDAGGPVGFRGRPIDKVGPTMGRDPLQFIFGNDPRLRKDASPLYHVRPGLPPFLVLYAQNDLLNLAQLGKEFGEALVKKQCDAKSLEVAKRGHITILVNASNETDPAGKAIADFIRTHLQ